MLENTLNGVADKEYYISASLYGISKQLFTESLHGPSSPGHRPYLSSPRSQLWWVLVGIRSAYTYTVLPQAALLLPSLQRRLWKLRTNLPDLIADNALH